MAKRLGVPAAPAARTWGGEAETVDDLPSVGYRQSAGGGVPLGERDEAWYWVASPHSWQVLAGRVVPSLRKIVLRAAGGQNNVDSVKGSDGRTRPDPTLALTLAARKGETVLDFHDERTFVDLPGGVRAPYLTRVKSTGGYISRFETLYGGSDERSTDTPAFAAWLDSLIPALIPHPPIHQLRRIEHSLTNRLNAYRDRAGGKSVYTARIGRLEADLKTVRAAIAAHNKRAQGGAPAETDDDLPPRAPVGAV